MFDAGQVVATSGVAAEMEEDPKFDVWVRTALVRHLRGDWGDMCKEDKHQNDLAVERGGLRIFSAYENGTKKIWIITEADRSATTILFPSEY